MKYTGMVYEKVQCKCGTLLGAVIVATSLGNLALNETICFVSNSVAIR